MRKEFCFLSFLSFFFFFFICKNVLNKYFTIHSKRFKIIYFSLKIVLQIIIFLSFFFSKMFYFSVIQYDVCTFQSSKQATGYTYQNFHVMPDSKCIEKCLERKASNPSSYYMNMIRYDWNNCYCVYNGATSWDSLYGTYLTFCYITNSKQF